MKKLLLIALMAYGAPAFAQEQKPLPCTNAIQAIGALMTSGASDEVIKYAISEMLGDEISNEDKHQIYLKMMYVAHLVRGIQILETPDDDQRNWMKTYKTAVCGDNSKIWPQK
jgi:hypothetical protein